MVLFGLCDSSNMMRAFLIVKNIIEIIKIVVPLIIIISAFVSFFKIVIVGNFEKNVLGTLFKSIVAGLIIFYIPSFFLFVFDKFIDGYDSSGVSYCYVNASLVTIDELIEKEEAEREINQLSYQNQLLNDEAKRVEELKREKDKLERNPNASEVKKEIENGNISGITVDENNNINIEKTYTSVHTLGKVNVDSKLKVSAPSAQSIAQSMCVTSKYYITANINSANNNDVLTVWDKSTGKKIAQHKRNFGHANGMTCNEKEGSIYLANCKPNGNLYYKIDLNSITSSIKYSSKSMDKGLSAISYDKVTGNYYTARGSKIFVYDSNMKYIKSINKIKSDTPQDIGGHDGIVYVLRYNGSGNSDSSSANNARNAVDLYRVSDGGYLGSYIINSKMEVESIDYDSATGKFVLYFNNGGSSENYIYNVKIG